MKHYIKLSALFFVFTLSVTLWMSFELGLLSFGKLEAAEESKPVKESKKEVVSEPSKELSPAKLPTETVKSPEVAVKAPSTETGALKNDNVSMTEKERQLAEREDFLKKQSEYYEKVILELKEKLSAQAKQNKESLNKSEAVFKEKLAKKDGEVAAIQKELSSWKDARAELFRGLYEKMESKKAAKILETMDTDLSNKILAGMKQDKAAEIMSKMAPDKAKMITEKTFSDRDIGSLNSKVNNSQTASNSK